MDLNSARQRAGIGKILYEELEKYLKKQHILTLVACVSKAEVPNNYITQKSVEFHQHMGYERVGTIKKAGYKFEFWYDLVFMEKQIGDYVIEPPRVLDFPDICKKREMGNVSCENLSIMIQ